MPLEFPDPLNQLLTTNMKTCPNCRIKVSEEKKFCNRCGAKLIPEQAATPDSIAKRQVFEARLAREPGDTSVIDEYAAYLSSIGLLDEARTLLARGVELHPENSTLRQRLATLFEAQEDWDNAAAQLLLLVQEQPTNITLREQLVHAFLTGGRRAEAAAQLAHLTQLNPDNLDYLTRRRDLLRDLRQDDQLIEVCRSIIQLQPQNVETRSLLADRLLVRGRHSEATAAFESVLKLDPKCARANLYVGIARHDAATQAASSNLSEAIALLEGALRAPGNLSDPEAMLARLYLSSSKLRSGLADADVEKLLAGIDRDVLDSERSALAAECLVILGNAQQQRSDIRDAIESYARALSFQDTPAARKLLADAHRAQAQSLAAKRSYSRAIKQYDAALACVQGDLGLQRERAALRAVRRRRRRIIGVTTSATAVVLLAVLYYGQWVLDVRVSPVAKLTLLQGATVIATTEGDNLTTGLVRYGSYTLRAQRDGYKPFERILRPPLGRRLEKLEITLTPDYGTIKVDSDPAGASVEIDGMKVGETPLTYERCLAKDSQLIVRYPGKGLFTKMIHIDAGQTLNLGKVSLDFGGVLIDSVPSRLEVFGNGQRFLGTTPLTIEALYPPDLWLSIRWNGRTVYSGYVTVNGGMITKHVIDVRDKIDKLTAVEAGPNRGARAEAALRTVPHEVRKRPPSRLTIALPSDLGGTILERKR
jgi:tetratricopeptide (TPR) repeat protein